MRKSGAPFNSDVMFKELFFKIWPVWLWVLLGVIFLALNGLMIVKGYVNPLPEAQAILPKYNKDMLILTEFQKSSGVASETYLLIDTDSFESITVKITKDKDTVDVIEKHGGLWEYVLMNVILLVLVIWPLVKSNKT